MILSAILMAALLQARSRTGRSRERRELSSSRRLDVEAARLLKTAMRRSRKGTKGRRNSCSRAAWRMAIAECSRPESK